MPFLLVQFGAKAAKVLGLFGAMVGFTGQSFSCAFFVVETATVLFAEALDVLVLRHRGAREGGVIGSDMS